MHYQFGLELSMILDVPSQKHFWELALAILTALHLVLVQWLLLK